MRRGVVVGLCVIAGCGGELDGPLDEDESAIFDLEHGFTELRARVDARLPGELFTRGALGFVIPERGRGVFAEIMREDGSTEDVRIETDDHGEVSLISSEERATAAAAASVPLSQCADRARNLQPWKWSRRFDWSFNAATAPSNLDAARTETALRAAANNIVRTDNACALEDLVSATHRYLGRTTRRASIDAAGKCGSSDGANVVSFGDLPAGTLGVTCTWYTLEGDAVESDVKLNKVDHAWTIDIGSSCRNRFHVEAIMTHELGHAFGLGHVSEAEHGNLTMSTRAAPCQKSETTLGKGDIIGLRRKY